VLQEALRLIGFRNPRVLPFYKSLTFSCAGLFHLSDLFLNINLLRLDLACLFGL
jgi:hypothetical protein